MKKSTIVMLLILAVAMNTSCQKETFQDDLAINLALDKELFDNVLTMTDAQLEDHARRKHKILTRIKATHPGIKIEVIYPEFMNHSNSANKGSADCAGQYSSMISDCNWSYATGGAAFIFLGAGITFFSGGSLTGLAVAVGGGGLASETKNYVLCRQTAFDVKTRCDQNTKK